jgi:hypothetical protein
VTPAELIAAIRALGLHAQEGPDGGWFVDLPIAPKLREALVLEGAPCVAVVEPMRSGRWLTTIDVVDEIEAAEVQRRRADGVHQIGGGQEAPPAVRRCPSSRQYSWNNSSQTATSPA